MYGRSHADEEHQDSMNGTRPPREAQQETERNVSDNECNRPDFETGQKGLLGAYSYIGRWINISAYG